MGEWFKVAKLSDLPEDTGKLVNAGGDEVALFKVGDKVFAIHPVCPHQGGPLQDGGVHECRVMCPWHGWEFDLGTGKCSFNDAISVPVYKVSLEGDDVFIEN